MATKQKIFSGILWTSIQTIINRGFGFIVKLVLARLLLPEDFGLIGMSIVFIGLIRVFNEMGMSAALIQRKKELLKESDFHTAFWTGIVWALLVFLIVSLLIGPLAAWFYETPILVKIIPALSISILVNPISLVHQVQLTKNLNFKKLAIINNVGSVGSGILALLFAYFNAGVWALVINSVAGAFIMVPLFFKATGWRPKFKWSKKAFRKLFGFGVYTTGTNLFGKLTSNIDYLIVGKLIGASALGFYSFAFIITDIFRGQLMGVIKSVMYPVFAQLQDEPDKMKNYYLTVIRINALLVNPVMFGIILFSDFLIPKLFGIKWTDSIILIKILATSVIIHMLVSNNSSLYRAKGKVQIELKMQLVKTLFFFIPAIVTGTYYFGTKGTASGYLLAKILTVAYTLNCSKKYLNIGVREMLSPSIRPLLLTGLPTLFCYILITQSVQNIIVLITYIVLIILLYSYFEAKSVFKVKELIFKA